MMHITPSRRARGWRDHAAAIADAIAGVFILAGVGIVAGSAGGGLVFWLLMGGGR